MRYNIFIFVLLGMLAFFQYRLWFEAGGMRDLHDLKLKLSNRMQENDQLKKDNLALVKQIENLKHGKDAAEARARNELGMIKKDETFYQIINPEGQSH